MSLPNTGSFLASLTQPNRVGALTERVRNLPVAEFVCLLDFITAEFQQFLRAFDLVNDRALESILEQILDALTFKVGQILAAERTTIFLVDPDKRQLWAKVHRADGVREASPEENRPQEVRIPFSAGITGRVAATGEAANVPDATTHPLFQQDFDSPPRGRNGGSGAESPTRSLLCVPIASSAGQIVAVVQLLNKTGSPAFDREDEARFQEFASAFGIVLESCQSFYAAARNQRGAAALLKATTCLAQSLDLDKTLRAVMDEARDLMQAERSNLFLLDRETGRLWTKFARDDGSEAIADVPPDRGIARYVAATGQTLNVPDAAEDPRFDPHVDRQAGYQTRNLLCMPVFDSEGTLIGVSQLINRKQGSFTSSDEAFMRAFNIQAGIAIENAQLFEDVLLEQQYQKDILQSLSNAVISTDMQGRIATINEAALELLGCPVRQDRGLAGKACQARWEQRLLHRPLWEVVPLENLQSRLKDSLQTGARHFVPEQTLQVGLYDGQGAVGLEPIASEPIASEANEGAAIGAGPEANAPEANAPESSVSKSSARAAEPGGAAIASPDESAATRDRAASSPENRDVAWQTVALAVPEPQSAQWRVLWDPADELDGVRAAERNGRGSPPPLTVPADRVQPIACSLNLTVNPLTNPEGKVRGGLVVLEDISREKRMKATMYRYMTPGVAERVMALGEDALMVGERKDVTILFSDIRGYTTLTENLGAAEVVDLLNQYFETMVEAVFNYSGTLDKFIGDALMAVFGAPLPLTEDHAWLAVQAALEMRDRLKRFNQRRLFDNQPRIRIGIGISSGEVVAGNIGSKRRMDYTVIGDGVNVSSRLENATKTYLCDIILSEFTYRHCKDLVWVRELDRVRVKGKHQAIDIYELIGDRQEPLSDATESFLEQYHLGRAAYNRREFQRAIVHFAAAQQLQPHDRAVKLHLDRCARYLEMPPPVDWDGTFNARYEERF